ncbi:DEAD/DEAH box helicase [Infirmifilum sp.]|uniref:DEAD/DEAH box helicase n=1 Tax=Infirmifilum sp. TaxID=2856575 RepID=UPI003D1013EE
MLESIKFLRSRFHPEKPHISVLAPPPQGFYSVACNTCRELAEEVEVEEEEGVEETEELEEVESAARSRNPGHAFGAAVVVEGNGEIDFKYSFYVRRGDSGWGDAQRDPHTPVLVVAKILLADRRTSLSVLWSIGGSKVESGPVDVGGCGAVVFAVAPQEAWEPKGYEEAIKRLARHHLRNMPVAIRAEPLVKVIRLDNRVSSALAAEVVVKGNTLGRYTQSFAVLVATCRDNGEIWAASYLLNLGGCFHGSRNKSTESWLRKVCQSPWKAYTFDGQGRWALGYLLEVEGEVTATGDLKILARWGEHGLEKAATVGCMLIEEEKGKKYLLRDYHLAQEELYQLEEGRAPGVAIQELAGKAGGGCPGFQKAVDALWRAIEDLGIKKLYRFQEEAAAEIMGALDKASKGESPPAVVITARTAGGKTLAFLIPAILLAIRQKLCGKRVGVKAILIYPTKALANDQVEEVAHLLYALWRRGGPEITFGLLHGDVPGSDEVKYSREPVEIPASCPIHRSNLVVSCDEDKCVATCTAGGTGCQFAEFVSRNMKKVRDELYYEPPDILITDEDMLNRILSGSPKTHIVSGESAPWYEWQLFGKPYLRCAACKHTYPAGLRIKKCKVCGSDRLEGPIDPSRPSMIVLDEAHQLYGSFGIQVHHMLSLLEEAVGSKIVYVLSSATMGRASQFASSLLGKPLNEIRVVAAGRSPGQPQGGSGSAYRRWFALIMPKAYTRDATLVRLLAKFYEEYQTKARSTPRGVIFTNTLAESNELVASLRNDFGAREARGRMTQSVRVSGHTTDYSQDRRRVELEFKRGQLEVLVATSTLEVGVDYGVIDYVAIYGLPYRVSSFVQRVGRAGRGRDAVVFVVFDPESPVNYDFFENHKMLYDGELRDKAIEREVMEVTPYNEVAIERAVKRWAIAEVQMACSDLSSPTHKLMCGLVAAELKNTEERKQVAEILKRRLEEKLRTGKMPKSLIRAASIKEQLVLQAVNEVVRAIWQRAERIKGLRELVDTLGGEETLYNLRHSDVEVIFEFPPQPRKREMRYAVSHSLWGQIVAYRGVAYQVNAVQPSRVVDIGRWLQGDH